MAWRTPWSDLRVRRAGLLLFAVIALTVIGLLVFEGRLHIGKLELYWIQVFSGNWGPDFIEKRPQLRFQFVLGAVIAVVLNILSLLALWNAFLNFSIVRSAREMNIKTAFALRESAIKDQLISTLAEKELTEMVPLIEQAFKDGEKTWRERILPRFMPAREIKKFFATVQDAPDPN